MQDKDFDQLFKQRFEAFEVEPSARSWDQITGQLDGQKKKRKAFPSYWMAAASLVIMASAILFLYRPAEVIKLRGKAAVQAAARQKPAVMELEPQSIESAGTFEEQRDPVAPARRERALVAKEHAPQDVNRSKQNAGTISERADLVQGEVMLANQPLRVGKVPGAEIKIEETSPILAQNAPVTDETEQGPGRQRVRGVGGLVNFVIAQVDKREDKIIEFKDGEEGTEVSGINLGPIKFKSRNR